MQKIIAVKRDADKDLYFFIDTLNLQKGEKVVVQFDEFQTICTVARVGLELEDNRTQDFVKILRRATESDLKKFNELKQKSRKQLPEMKKKSLELGLMMKFVDAEYSLDDSKIVITFSSEERVDFRQFLKELASMLKIRIELKQIGQRDEVKVCGGVGPCGQPCCCSRFLDDFNHVTVKMAKVQGLSLSPTKINGICGRLMCCLGYESDMYEEVLKKMPKVGSTAKSVNGEGTVVYNDILRERVSIKRLSQGDTFVVEDFALDEIEFGDKKVDFSAIKKQKEVENQEKQRDFEKKVNEKLNEKTDKFEMKPAQINTDKDLKNLNAGEEMTLGLPDKNKTGSNDGENKKHFNKKFRFNHNKNHRK
ncbi:MAG: stage 0 sporulation protein [Clostridia bacterium]|nr:stage 0 sporulation protein [Clostridia bacterium]